MSYVGMTTTVLANGLATAVAKDEKEIEDGHPDCGFDLSAGMFGAHVSAWLREVAGAMDDLARRIDGPLATGCTYPDCSCEPNGDTGCNSPNAAARGVQASTARCAKCGGAKVPPHPLMTGACDCSAHSRW